MSFRIQTVCNWNWCAIWAAGIGTSVWSGMTIKVSTDGAEQRSPISLSLKLIFLIRRSPVGTGPIEVHPKPPDSQQHYQAQSTTPTKIALERKGGRAKRQ